MNGLTVGDLLRERGGGIVHIHASSSVMDAAKLMLLQDISAVLVMDGADLPTGIFSERELLERVVAAGMDPSTTPLSLVSNRDVKCVSPTTSSEAALALMHLQRYSHLLVVDGPVASGVVSLRELATQLVRHGEGRYESTLRLVGALPPLGPSQPADTSALAARAAL